MTIPTIAAAQAPAPPAAAPAPPPPQTPPSLVPSKVVDLMTPEGSAVFDAQWKSMEAKIVEGPAIANAMPGFKTSYDIQPHAGERGFDDSSWPVIGAKGLADRRGGGKVSFIWYRANLTIPAKGGGLRHVRRHGGAHGLRGRLRGSLGQWADAAPRRLHQPSHDPRLHMPNRVVLADAVKPGDKFQIAVFGVNGPISVAPMNFVWFREAKVEFFH